MRLLVYHIQGKLFVKASPLKKAVSFTSGNSENTRSPDTAKFSVVSQRLEQVKGL